MKVLTMIATIVMPMTLVTGLYGMNFKYMPELHWVLGYPMALLMIFGIGAGMYAMFHKRGWF